MKIVDVSEFYAEQGGGVRTYTNQKLEAAQRLGHELVVLAPGPRNAEEARHGGRVVWLESPRFPLDARYHVFVRARAVREVLEREAPDVIEGSSVWSGGWFASLGPQRAFKALVFHQDPVAVYGHTALDCLLSPTAIDDLCAPYWSLLRRLSQRYDCTIAASSWLAERLAGRGLPRTHAVDFGCDVSPFGPHQAEAALRSQLLAMTGTPAHGVLLVCVSRHHPEKRLRTLCQAIGKLRERRPVGLVIFGDGPFRPWVECWARAAGGVHVAGYTTDRAELSRVLASCDALLHGSAAETYGIAIAEALSSGLPVVVPDRGGAFELSRPDCSELYPPGDAQACAAAVERLFARPRTALRAAALRHARLQVRDLNAHFAELFAYYAAQVVQRRSKALSSRAGVARGD